MDCYENLSHQFQGGARRAIVARAHDKGLGAIRSPLVCIPRLEFGYVPSEQYKDFVVCTGLCFYAGVALLNLSQ